MTFFRRVMIPAMVLLTAWSGTPHMACRCSSGEVRLFCARMNQQARQRDSATCDSTSGCGERKSCCGGSGGACCGSPATGSSQQGSECCATGCSCTPIYFPAEAGPTLKKVVLPELIQFDLAAISVMEIRLPRITCVDLSTLGFDQRVPDDLIVLCERWLI